MIDIELEIMIYSYWEQVKAEKDFARALPPEHPVRVRLNAVINDLTEKINDKRNGTKI